MTADFVSFHLFFFDLTAGWNLALTFHPIYQISYVCEVNNSCSSCISSNKVKFSKSLHFVFFLFSTKSLLVVTFSFFWWKQMTTAWKEVVLWGQLQEILRKKYWEFPLQPSLKLVPLQPSGQSCNSLTSLSLSNVRFMHTNFVMAEVPTFNVLDISIVSDY